MTDHDILFMTRETQDPDLIELDVHTWGGEVYSIDASQWVEEPLFSQQWDMWKVTIQADDPPLQWHYEFTSYSEAGDFEYSKVVTVQEPPTVLAGMACLAMIVLLGWVRKRRVRNGEGA